MQQANDHVAGLRACLTGGALYVRGDGERSEAEFLEYGRDRTRRAAPDFQILIFPTTTEEVAAVVRYCYEHSLAITPSGGRTGLSGGAVAATGEVVISFDRMTRLLEFDPYLPALHVEAGMITAVAQTHARERGYQFPLDLAASGSSQVGGNIATNAGGTRVISIGGLRDYVTGLTVVTGAGEIVRFPGHILKNNSGIDLRQLFIGSEGMLGLITEAVIRLAPAPRREATALCAVADVAGALDLLAGLRAAGLRPLAFEFFDAASLGMVCEHLTLAPPFREAHAAYVVLGWDEALLSLDAAVETVFTGSPAANHIIDLRLAGNSEQAALLWKYRESISESLAMIPPAVHKQDVSVPAGRMTRFLRDVHDMLAARFADVRLLVFGHLGDGNLHLNYVPGAGGASGARPDGDAIDEAVFPLIAAADGSISAEHGIGLLKKKYLHYSRSAAEIQVMRGIKALLDPRGILNPGKVLPDSGL